MQEQCLKPKRVLVLASGEGSNFEAIVKYFGHKVFIELICDKKDVNVLKRAQRLNIRHYYVEFDALEDFLRKKNAQDACCPDLYVLAGFMRVLPQNLLNLMEYDKNKIINIHPSLLPEFKGKNAIERAFEAGVLKTGVSVHFVNQNLDGGKIIERHEVETSGLSLDALRARMHDVEHLMYPEIIEKLLFKKNVLVFGGGAREHALAHKISLSPYLGQLYLAKPNDGFKNLGQVIEFSSYDELLAKALKLGIDLLVVGPEKPLFDGITDMFCAKGIKVIGANKAWARLEESKIFAKEFMAKCPGGAIKTADYKTASNVLEAKAALDYFKEKGSKPPVIKADGPALGKGVYLPVDYADALRCAKCYLDGKFGDASRRILIEERIFGVEVSVMSLWDGDTLVSFPPASDYKCLLDDNKGPNTGGMGSYAPSKITQAQKKHIDVYLKKLECALRASCADFCGIVYSGLILTDASKNPDGRNVSDINTDDGVYVLEYNMRFGDPETQSLLEILDDEAGCDLLDIFIKMTQKRLRDVNLSFKDKKAYCLTLASKGYPDNPEKGAEILGLDAIEEYGCKVYFAGVKATSGSLIVNGGRVMSIVKAENSDNSRGGRVLDDIYKAAEKICYDGKIYRKDIGR